MKPKATHSFMLNGIFYEKGDEVNIKNKDELIRLNEKGFIEPLSAKQLQNYKIEEIKINKKED